MILHKIITGLIYPAILGALMYCTYEYYYDFFKRNKRKDLLSIRNVLILFFFIFYFFNFLIVMYAVSYNLYAFISDFIETVLMYIGFKMLINPEMKSEKNNTSLKKAYILGFFVLLNMIFWKIVESDFNRVNVFIMNIVSITLMVNGWIWGFKKLWYNKYVMFIFCILLVGLYAFWVYNILPK